MWLGLLREEKSFAAQLLRERGVRLDTAREQIAGQQRDTPGREPRKPPGVLGEFSAYLSDPGKQTGPLVGRATELDRLTEILCRYTTKNPVLVGEPGVGKRTIVGGLARRIAEGSAPRPLAARSVVALDLPPLRVLDHDQFWQEKLDGALVTAGERGTVFFVNHMHNLPSGTTPISPLHVNELLRRPLVARKIQCISTATPASYAKLVADQHWLARCFEPVQVAPASEDDAVKVLSAIKGRYEQFHSVTYADDALTYAVHYASRCVRNGHLPGTAVDVIDEAGASAQVHQRKLPEELLAVHERIRFIVERMESAIANHEFEKARFYSDEERKERENLRQLAQAHKIDETIALVVGRDDIETVVSKLTGLPVSAIRESLPPSPTAPSSASE